MLILEGKKCENVRAEKLFFSCVEKRRIMTQTLMQFLVLINNISFYYLINIIFLLEYSNWIIIVSIHLLWINVHRYLLPLRYLKKKKEKERFRKKFPRNNATPNEAESVEEGERGEKRKKKKKKRKILCSFQISRLDFFHSIFIKTREPFLGNALRCFPLQCRGGGGARVSRGVSLLW